MAKRTDESAENVRRGTISRADASKARAKAGQEAEAAKGEDLTANQERMANQLEDRLGLGDRLDPASGRNAVDDLLAGAAESSSGDPLADRLAGKDGGGGGFTRPDVTVPGQQADSPGLADPTTTRSGADLLGKVQDDLFGKPPSTDSGTSLTDKSGIASGMSAEASLVDNAVGFAGGLAAGALAAGSAAGAAAVGPAGIVYAGSHMLTKYIDERLGLSDKAQDAYWNKKFEDSPEYKAAAEAQAKREEAERQKAEKAAEGGGAGEAEGEAAAATGEAGAAEGEGEIPEASQPAEDAPTPEGIAFAQRLREASGYDGRGGRGGEVDPTDPNFSDTAYGTGDLRRAIAEIDAKGLVGSGGDARLDGVAGSKGAIPQGSVRLGNDHAINWGPDGHAGPEGLSDDIPDIGAGRPEDLSHLNPAATGTSETDDDSDAVE
jgi:hypothetical protein